MKIINQEIKFDDAFFEGDQNYCRLITKYDNGAIEVKSLTIEEAAQLTAENKF